MQDRDSTKEAHRPAGPRHWRWVAVAVWAASVVLPCPVAVWYADDLRSDGLPASDELAVVILAACYVPAAAGLYFSPPLPVAVKPVLAGLTFSFQVLALQTGLILAVFRNGLSLGP